MGDLMVQLLVFLIFGIIIAFIVGVIYKFRNDIKRYFRDPDVGSSYCVPRKTTLKRKIEDAEDEIKWLEAKESKQAKTETEG